MRSCSRPKHRTQQWEEISVGSDIEAEEGQVTGITQSMSCWGRPAVTSEGSTLSEVWIVPFRLKRMRTVGSKSEVW